MRETLTEKESRLRRLYDAIEAGAVDLGDPTLNERIARRREERDLAQTAVDRAASELNPAARMTTTLRTGSIELRHADLGSIIDGVQIHTDKINIIGRKNQLDRAILLGDRKPAGVRCFVREWRSALPCGACSPTSRTGSSTWSWSTRSTACHAR
jgi:hypothetical protein